MVSPRTPVLKGAPKPRPAAARGRRSQRDRREALWRAFIQRPTPRQRNPLVETYQPLVRDIVRRLAPRLPRKVDLGDLETAGTVGLMAAIESFDPERGVRFESYCEMRVRGAVLDELRAQDWLPRPWRARLERHKRTLERLRSELCREPADEEVSLAMQLSAREYRELQSFGAAGLPLRTLSFAARREEEGHNLEVIADPEAAAPGEKLTREELLQLVAQRLSDQEYRIVYLRYWEDLPMREIGQIESLSESRVCKIHARLIERLRDRFRVHAEN